MKRAIGETDRRRKLQTEFNEEHGITPQTIKKEVREVLRPVDMVAETRSDYKVDKEDMEGMTEGEILKEIADLEEEMQEAAKNLQFELAAQIRDEIEELREKVE